MNTRWICGSQHQTHLEREDLQSFAPCQRRRVERGLRKVVIKKVF